MRFGKNVGQRGFTLTELMVALFAGMILIAASYATFIAQNRSYVAQEGVSEVNTQSNIAFSMIANDIKMAGFGTSDSMNEHPVNGLTAPVTFTDSTTGTDTVTIVAGYRLIGTLGTPGWSLTEDADGDGNNDTVPFNLNTIRIYNAGGNLTLAANDAISIDGIQFTTVNSVTVVDADEWDVGIDDPTASPYPILDITGDLVPDNGGGRPVYLVENVTYSVNADGELLRTDTKNTSVPVVAENVEDLQFGYAVDSDEDGALDDVDASGVFDQGDFVYAVADPSTIGAVRVNVLARTGQQDPNQQGQGHLPDAIENRDHDETATDGFKRRWWQSTVKVRND